MSQGIFFGVIYAKIILIDISIAVLYKFDALYKICHLYSV